MTASADDRLLDAVYRLWGKPATYTDSGGDPVNCTIQVYRPGIITRETPLQPIGLSGHVEIGISDLAIVVRTCEVAEPNDGGVFQVYLDTGRTQPGRSYRVEGQPLPYDPDGVEWRCTSSTS